MFLVSLHSTLNIIDNIIFKYKRQNVLKINVWNLIECYKILQHGNAYYSPFRNKKTGGNSWWSDMLVVVLILNITSDLIMIILVWLLLYVYLYFMYLIFFIKNVSTKKFHGYQHAAHVDATIIAFILHLMYLFMAVLFVGWQSFPFP